jgi:putative FmdB family regulatory protein
MVYVYDCRKCDADFDVIKPVTEMENNEFCPACGSPGERRFVPSRVFFSKTNAEYNPALGKVTKNAKHRAEVAKRMGLVEIGNDYGNKPDTIHKEFDQKREATKEARYAEAIKKAQEAL